MIDTSVFTPANLQAHIDRYFQENPERDSGMDAYALMSLTPEVQLEVMVTFEEGKSYRLEFTTSERYLVLETRSDLEQLCKDAVSLANFLNGA